MFFLSLLDVYIVEIHVPSDPSLATDNTNDVEDTLDKPMVKKVRFQPEHKPCKRKPHPRVTMPSRRTTKESRSKSRSRKTNSATLDKDRETPEDTKNTCESGYTSHTEGETVVSPVQQDEPPIDNDVCYEVEAILGHRIVS